MKSQLDNKTLLENAQPGHIVDEKAVMYDNNGGIHSKSIFIKDDNTNEVKIQADNQLNNNIPLIIPNLQNFNGSNGNKKSEIMVTSIDQVIEGHKTFQNIDVANPITNSNPTTKTYVDTNLNTKLDKISNDNLNMNSNIVTNSGRPVGNNDLTTKVYVDNQLTDKASLSKTTVQTFQGRVQVPDFNSGSHNGADVANLTYLNSTFLNKKTGGSMSNSITFISSLPNNQKQIHNLGSPQYNTSAANKSYVDNKIANIPAVDTSSFLKRDGSVSMTANLDLGGKKITNLGVPTSNENAVNKHYVDHVLSASHILPSNQKNEFTYLYNVDETSSESNIIMNSFTDFAASPHRNKKAYNVTLQKNAGSNDYRSILGFNLFPLPLGKYTLVFEFFPSEMTNVQLSAYVSSATINNQVFKAFNNYCKLLTQIDNNSKQAPDFIYLLMRGTATTPSPKAHIIVYGIKEWSNSVPPGLIYDNILWEMFDYDDGNMKINTNMDMDNHRIMGLSDGVENTDAVTKKQLDIIDYDSKGYIYRLLFGQNYYDLTETSRFNINDVFGIVINSISPYLTFLLNRRLDDYSPKYGIHLGTDCILQTPMIQQNSNFTLFISLELVGTPLLVGFYNKKNNTMPFPHYSIHNTNKLRLYRSVSEYYDVAINNFSGKQTFIWICYYAPLSIYKIAIGNYLPHINKKMDPPENFSLNHLRIIFPGHITKIGFVDRFIDVSSIDHHRIILEEKRNGSFLG